MDADGYHILDVDLLAFEKGTNTTRAAVVAAVQRSLQTGFVYTSHDLSAALLDDAYGMLQEFFALPAAEKAAFVAPGSNGQTGYTGLLVETAAVSDHPDWKEMLNWSRDLPSGHPLRAKYPHRYMDQVLPDAVVPGISAVLNVFHDRIFDLQRRFLRVIALGIGCHNGRRLRSGVWSAVVADVLRTRIAFHAGRLAGRRWVCGGGRCCA